MKIWLPSLLCLQAVKVLRTAEFVPYVVFIEAPDFETLRAMNRAALESGVSTKQLTVRASDCLGWWNPEWSDFGQKCVHLKRGKDERGAQGPTSQTKPGTQDFSPGLLCAPESQWETCGTEMARGGFGTLIQHCPKG